MEDKERGRDKEYEKEKERDERIKKRGGEG